MIKASRGITLLEVLLVVAILGLLMALMFPLVAMGKRAAKRSTCIQQLRQIGLSIAMYESDLGGFPPSLEALKDSGILSSAAIVLCPEDPVEGYASKNDQCRGTKRPFSQSYETVFGWPAELLTDLKAADSNHGIVVCRLHGNHTDRYQRGLDMFCRFSWFMFEGPLLRLRKDGSVKTAQLKIKRKNVKTGLYEETIGVWELFTDAPNPNMPGHYP